MPVYFVSEKINEVIKIGVSTQIQRRLGQLQTANANELELMGWIVSEDDYLTEMTLHRKYGSKRERGEWFSISQADVLRELTLAHGFIPKNENAFEIFGYDRDGIPEYVGVCKWCDFEYYECCPFCGCFCGMHFNEAMSMYHCINCDTLTDFSELSRSHEQL
ncbi:MAG: GIY-YIG nuclease family protein [Gallionellaceae bacterium]